MGTISKNKIKSSGHDKKRNALQEKQLPNRHSTIAVFRSLNRTRFSHLQRTTAITMPHTSTESKPDNSPTIETSEHIIRHEMKNIELLQSANLITAHDALLRIEEEDPSIRTRKMLEKEARTKLSYAMISKDYVKIIDDGLMNPGKQVTFKLITWINDIFYMFWEEFRLNGIELKKENLLLGSKEYVVNGDLAAILYACVNIIKNAIKFKKKNKNGTITGSLKEDNGHFSIEITDNGIGMTEDQTKHLFDKTRKRYTDRPGDGSGLGNVMTCLERASGKLAVESELDKWTKFTIAAPPLEIMEIIQNDVDYSLVRLLVVEDEDMNCRILKKTLIKIGITEKNIAIVKSEEEGIKLYKTAHNETKPFTFVMTDLHMKEQNDGLKLIEGIREFESKEKMSRPAHILILSGDTMNKQIEKMKYQYDGFLKKPYNLQEIASNIIPAVSEINRQERKKKVCEVMTRQFFGDPEACSKITTLIAEYDASANRPRR